MRRVLALVVAGLLLGGCSQSPPYAPESAIALQSHLLEVTEAAAEGDAEAALVRLDELLVATKVELANGGISQARHDSILAAIALVRLDLERIVAEAERQAGEERKQELAEQQRLLEQERQRLAQERQRTAEDSGNNGNRGGDKGDRGGDKGPGGGDKGPGGGHDDDHGPGGGGHRGPGGHDRHGDEND